VDAVFDCVGNGLLASTALVGRDDVRACGIVEPAEGAKMVFARRDPQILAEAAALAETGKLRPRVGLVFPLARASEAHQAVREGRVGGRVVLSVA